MFYTQWLKNNWFWHIYRNPSPRPTFCYHIYHSAQWWWMRHTVHCDLIIHCQHYSLKSLWQTTDGFTSLPTILRHYWKHCASMTSVIFKSSYDNVLRWMPQNLTDDKSTLVQVSHYLNHCWPRSPTSYGVTRPQWVNIKKDLNKPPFDIGFGKIIASNWKFLFRLC